MIGLFAAISLLIIAFGIIIVSVFLSTFPKGPYK